MSFKKFVVFFITVAMAFSIFHLIIWKRYTSQIFERKDGLLIGDLGRLSYQLDSLQPRKTEFNLPKKHFHKENWVNEPIDLITIGDSFSNGGGGGLNPYYQDYLASKYNLNILNLHSLSTKVNPIDLLITLYNKNWFEEHKPKFLLIEIVERQALEYLAKDFNWELNDLEIDSIFANAPKEDKYKESLNFINDANYKFIYYGIQYKRKIEGNENVFLLPLEKELFSNNKFSNKLLVYHEDIRKIVSSDNFEVEKLNSNLNKLSRLFNKKGITVIFMPAVDKYDLYGEFIKDNTYPKNYFFDKLRNLNKQYLFIDTKNILINLLNKNVLDVYHADDTHWTYKASEAIIEDEIFKNLFK